MNSYNLAEDEKKLLLELAKKVVDTLGENTPFPEILNCFPKEKKIKHSEKFIAKNFLSYDFFRYAFKTDYSDGDNSYTLFIMETKNEHETKTILKKYFKFITNKDQEIKTERFSLKDPYHGEILIGWQDKYVWGTLNLSDRDRRQNCLQEIKEKQIYS